ncbi:MAG TPA: DNA-deoxyinosine glycosylase [Spirochaetota bacterium]|nr:DNA-deoxyinosine glycosylase [Spirochaetota bacterium]HQP50073.1 DNA-deoxyinosine glycosylase [Spirochaetota bacterium]
MTAINSFEPIIDKSSRVLILGSIPGIESLKLQQYYANNRNHFWKIIYALFNAVPDTSYVKRTGFLLSKKIALWDVIDNCTRQGSLDSNIRDEHPNDFKKLFMEYPSIKYIFFNGSKAHNSYLKYIGFNEADGFSYKKLPSTSPAHAVKFEDKLKEWLIIREYIGALKPISL